MAAELRAESSVRGCAATCGASHGHHVAHVEPATPINECNPCGGSGLRYPREQDDGQMSVPIAMLDPEFDDGSRPSSNERLRGRAGRRSRPPGSRPVPGPQIGAAKPMADLVGRRAAETFVVVHSSFSDRMKRSTTAMLPYLPIAPKR